MSCKQKYHMAKLADRVNTKKGVRHCRNCDSLPVVVVAHFDPHLAGCHLAAIGRTAFVVSSFGLSYTFSKTNFSLILEVSRNLFVHRLHLQALVNVNIAF